MYVYICFVWRWQMGTCMTSCNVGITSLIHHSRHLHMDMPSCISCFPPKPQKPVHIDPKIIKALKRCQDDN